MDRLELFENRFSTAAQVARVVAAQLDLPLELHAIDFKKGEHKAPAYMKLNPNGKVPLLKHGEFYLWESNAIALYLTSLRPEADLMPRDPKLKAQVDQWLFWKAAHFSPSFGRVVRERVIKPMFGLGEPDETAVAEGMKEFGTFASVLNEHLANRDWVVGDRLTLADLSLACALSHRTLAQASLDPWPNLTAWLARVESLPSFKA